MQAARYDIQILFSSIFNYIFTPLLRMTKLVSRRIKCLCNVTTKNLFYVSRFLPLIWNKEMKKNLDSLQTWMWKAFLRLPMKVFIYYFIWRCNETNYWDFCRKFQKKFAKKIVRSDVCVTSMCVQNIKHDQQNSNTSIIWNFCPW